MLKKTVTYKDFNGETVMEDLYFNINANEVFDLVDLQPRIEAWQKRVAEAGTPENIQIADVRELLDLIKSLIDLSFGQRSEDGKRFVKHPVQLNDFQSSAAYDELLLSMFDNGGVGAIDFINSIIPYEMAERLAKGAESAPPTTDVPLPGVTTGGEMTAVKEEVPAWIREDRDPTPAEVLNMTQPQLADAYRRKLEKQNT